jgi:VWFA-related protein
MSHFHSISFSSALVLGAGLLFCPKPQAQTTGTSPQPNVEPLRVYSREVVVDISVSDANGKPVRGLTREDFTIQEDGKPISPRSFVEHRTDQDQPAASAVSRPSLAPGTFTNAGMPESTRPLNMLLIDSLDTPITTQSIVQKRLLEFVDKITPGTRMAVFTLSSTGQLSLVQGFTTDPELLRKAIKSHKMDLQIPPLEDFGQDPNAQVAPSPDENKEAARILNSSPAGKLDMGVECSHMSVRGQYTFDALSEIARYVSGMPGRKNLIWYTGLFPTSMRDNHGTVCVDFRKDFGAASERLAHSHVALYPVDPRALDILAHENPDSRIVKLQNAEHLRMEGVAEDGGGKAFYNNNDLAAAAVQAVDAGSNYYTVAYLPQDEPDTRRHTISASVDKPNLNLIYRHSYHALAPDETISGQTIQKATPLQTAMMPGAPPPTEILFQVNVAQAPAVDNTLQPGNTVDSREMKPPYRHLTLSYAIDPGAIQFDKADDGNFHGQFEYAVDVYDSGSGKLLNSNVMAAKPSLPPAVYQSILANGARLRQKIDVPARGQYVLRIGVHDMTTHHTGAIEVPGNSVITAAP